MEITSQMWSVLIVFVLLPALIAVFFWSRRRDRAIRRLSQKHIKENGEIVLFSTGEGLMALGGMLFIAATPSALEDNLWKGAIFASVGFACLVVWGRYALCGHTKPCLLLNQNEIKSYLHGTIPWSNVESVSRIKFKLRLVEIDYLVLKLRDINTARLNFIAPLRWFHKFNRSRELKFKIANMSLPGDYVYQYASATIA
jgi:hypothetical protein